MPSIAIAWRTRASRGPSSRTCSARASSCRITAAPRPRITPPPLAARSWISCSISQPQGLVGQQLVERHARPASPRRRRARRSATAGGPGRSRPTRRRRAPPRPGRRRRARRAAEERHAQPLGERRGDDAAAGAVGGRDGDERHRAPLHRCAARRSGWAAIPPSASVTMITRHRHRRVRPGHADQRRGERADHELDQAEQRRRGARHGRRGRRARAPSSWAARTRCSRRSRTSATSTAHTPRPPTETTTSSVTAARGDDEQRAAQQPRRPDALDEPRVDLAARRPAPARSSRTPGCRPAARARRSPGARTTSRRCRRTARRRSRPPASA